LNIPLIDLSQAYQKTVQCLPQDFDFSQPVRKLIHRDEIHPNYVGHLFIATMIGHVFDKAVCCIKILIGKMIMRGFKWATQQVLVVLFVSIT